MTNKIDRFFDVLTRNKVSIVIDPIENQINYVKPDDDYDLHSYRILLLLLKCGTVKEIVTNHCMIYGREKFAFYDFLLRYPSYLQTTIQICNKAKLLKELNLKTFEQLDFLSPMVRYIRGPWDFRYNSIFSYMVSKRLVNVMFINVNKSNNKKQFCIVLTSLGTKVAKEIELIEKEWVNRTEVITKIFPSRTSNDRVKDFIQANFPELTLGGAINVY